MTTCSRLDCDKPLGRRSDHLCEPHYRKILHYTRDKRWFDPQPCADKIQQYRNHRWFYEDIARACGLPKMTITDTHNQIRKRVSKKTYDAIMALPDLEGSPVTRVGFKRRIQALAWMGWSQQSVARELNCTHRHLSDVASRERGFSADLANRLAMVYEKLSNTKGPNLQAASRARTLGFAPPAAWDDDTIDTAPDLAGGIYLNQPDARLRRKSMCSSGRHTLTGDNVYEMKSGERRCRACRKLRDQEYRERQKTA